MITVHTYDILAVANTMQYAIINQHFDFVHKICLSNLER